MFYGNRVRTFYSDSLLIEQEVCEADVVIGAVLLPGAQAPKLVTHDMIKKMKSIKLKKYRSIHLLTF